MRLIDADALIEKMNRVKFQTNISEAVNRYRPFLDYADVLGCINEQPTAYDPEKVVAELEEKSDDIPVQYEDNYKKGFDDGIGYAIEIVRKVGVE